MNKKNKIFSCVGKYWYQFAGYIIFTYILTQVIVSGSNKIASATDSLFAGEEVQLGILIVPFVIYTIIGTISAYIKSYMQNSFSLNVQTDVKNDTLKKLANLQFSYFDTDGSGGIMTKLVSDTYQLAGLLSEGIPEMCMGLITIVTIGVYILIMDYKLFLVTIICYPLLLWLANVLSKKVGKLGGNRRALYDQLGNTAVDVYNGIIVGRSYNLYEITKKRVNDVVAAILKNEYRRTKISSMSLTLGSFIRWIPRLLCYIFALYEVVNNSMSIGSFLAFSLLLDRIVHPLGAMPELFNYMREAWVSVSRIMKILDQPDELSGTEGFPSVSEGENAIEFSNISFSYDGERKIFDNLNMAIKKGENAALVGSSGGGKSTVFRILCGFNLPQSGNYKLYGHEYAQWDVFELRKQFALVSQNVFLFPDTIAVNVAYGKQEATREEIIEACKKANIHDFIMTLPKGYDTQVGERGAKLSGGQRQRISIARAFLKAAPILLLDEPTSAVDVGTESAIKEAIDNISRGKTVITIAHRLSTIENADRILVFSHGEIVETGTHEDLINKNGVYHSLYMNEKKVEGGDSNVN